MPTIPLRNDFDAERVRVLATAFVDGGHLRWDGSSVRGGYWRHGSADVAGLGSPVQRGRSGRSDRPQAERGVASVDAVANGGAFAGYRGRSRSRTGWGRALALHRSQATDPNALRRGLSRAERRQAAGRARVLAYFRAPAPRRPGCAGTGGI